MPSLRNGSGSVSKLAPISLMILSSCASLSCHDIMESCLAESWGNWQKFTQCEENYESCTGHELPPYTGARHKDGSVTVYFFKPSPYGSHSYEGLPKCASNSPNPCYQPEADLSQTLRSMYGKGVLLWNGGEQRL